MTVVQRSDVTVVQRSDVTVVQRSDQVTVIVATVIVATGTAVIHTGMTGTVTVEATVIAVVTATPEADLQRLRRYSSSLSHLRPCVAEMTGIVLVMLGPGEAFQVFAANVALIISGTTSLPVSLLHLPSMTEVEVVMGTGAIAFLKSVIFRQVIQAH